MIISACGGKPADVFFVLDSSGSISTRNFRKELKFTEDVASMFDTKENQVPNIGMNLLFNHFKACTFLSRSITCFSINKVYGKQPCDFIFAAFPKWDKLLKVRIFSPWRKFSFRSRSHFRKKALSSRRASRQSQK